MIKFADFINEKNNSSEFIIMRIKYGAIPLSPSTFERIFGEQTGRYLHVLDVDNIPRLKKLSRTKKTISAFNRIKNNSIFRGAIGINLENPCVALLEGKYVFDFNDDAYTIFDKQGRRWISVSDLETSRDFYENISDFIVDNFKEKLKKFDIDFYKLKDEKEKSMAIKLYFDATEEVLRDEEDNIIDYNKTLNNDYNEVVAYDFEIKKILLMEDQLESLDDKDELMKFVDSKEDLISRALDFILIGHY